MEYLSNAWNNVTYSVTNWWYYFFGLHGSQQLLLEYVIMEEDLSSNYVYTGDDAIVKSKNKSKIKSGVSSNCDSEETYKKLIENHDNTKYTFLFG